MHINSGFHLNQFVYEGIFILFGIVTVFVGVLYVAPPLAFHRRIGGEVVLAEGLGMVPVLGTYLIQAGDLTRTVYMASLPIVVATGLWVWMEELAGRERDEREGRNTMVLLFGSRFSGRVIVPALSALFCATLLGAVLTGSIAPIGLIGLILIVPLLKISAAAWNGYSNPEKMIAMGRTASRVHLAACIVLAASSLTVLLV